MISVFHGYSLLLCVFVKTRYQKTMSDAGQAQQQLTVTSFHFNINRRKKIYENVTGQNTGQNTG